jgi:hypothetical protein
MCVGIILVLRFSLPSSAMWRHVISSVHIIISQETDDFIGVDLLQDEAGSTSDSLSGYCPFTKKALLYSVDRGLCVFCGSVSGLADDSIILV